MSSLVSKKKGRKLYYYVVESARVDGKPRICLLYTSDAADE